ncbi:MAG: DUF3160 domain-containing protein [Thermoleophilia bacterium]
MTTRWLIPLAALAVALAAGCSSGGEQATTAEPTPAPAPEPAPAPAPGPAPAPAPEPAPEPVEPTQTESQPVEPPPTASEPAPAPAALELPAATTSFATYAPVPLADPETPAYAGPATPTSLEGVSVVQVVRKALREAGATTTLTRQGFVVVPSDLQLFHYAYQGDVYEGWPVFVTTDAAYHTWHRVFDKVLRDLEQEALLPKLEDLTRGLVAATSAQRAELASTPLGDAAAQAEGIAQVAAAALGQEVELSPLAAQELTLVQAHGGTETSPLLGTPIDYSLMTPRGHYTRTADLTRYFTAMSVLGQLAFCLPGTTDCADVAPLRTGILLARALRSDPSLLVLWRSIYEPTAFLVGLSDDYTPAELADAVEAAVPAAADDPVALADDAAVEAVAQALTTARPVRISPDRAAVRTMGTRFVVDSYVLDQLIYPNVGTPEKPRTLPSALDLAAAFGSDVALAALEQAGATDYEGYDEQLDRLREGIADRADADWGGTVYDAWLAALQPLFGRYGAAYPDFMRTDAWAAKSLQAGLGSYAELKHDTILYAKQAVAEGGDDRIPPRRNWVEPEPVAFGRLAAAVDLLRGGLAERGLLDEERQGLLDDLSGLLGSWQRIARDELAGRPIAKDDNDRLTYVGEELEAWFWRTADISANGDTEADQDAAIVADVASGPDGILELGTGRVDRIYVLVPDDEGAFQVAVGGVYSFYETTTPPGERLTDEEWRARLARGEAPPRPAWQAPLLPG